MRLKNLMKVALAVAVVIAGISTAEAKKKTRASGRATTGITVTQSADKTYSGVVFRTFATKKKNAKMDIAFPVSGPDAVVTAMRKWILGDDYSASVASPEAMMKQRMATVGPNRDVKDMQDSISVMYANDKVITLENFDYEYYGGAHGMFGITQATFLISDGTKLTADMLPSIEVLRPYIIKAMMHDLELTRDGLRDMCFGSLELPMGIPSVTSKGLQIQYGTYEIAPFAAGAPSCVIPLSEIKSLLSPQALRFF